jgi:hypothetical protein
MQEKRAPSDDALTAEPGDKIFYIDPSGRVDQGFVQSCFWDSSVKGGKVWAYKLDDPVRTIPNLWVTAVFKKTHTDVSSLYPSNMTTVLAEWSEVDKVRAREKTEFLSWLDNILPSPSLKTAIHCIIDGDVKNLKVARFLIDKRVKQLNELNFNPGTAGFPEEEK